MTATADAEPAQELVVLLAEDGTFAGTAPKATVHTASTPLHLAFSCYLFDPENRLLMTRRARTKPTFPGVWTNTVCGHPAPGEPAQDAAVRRAGTELGLRIAPPRLVLPEFRYVADMHGIREHEWCPVYVGRISADARPRAAAGEVDEFRWVAWRTLVEQAFDADLPGDGQLSPWCREQVRQLVALGDGPAAWPDADPGLLPAALTHA